MFADKVVLTLPGGEIWAIEVKRSSVPKVERGFYSACSDLGPARRYVVYPGEERLALDDSTEAVNLVELAGLAGVLRGIGVAT